MRLIRALLVAAATLLSATAAPAAPPQRPLAHYTHQRWSEESDAPRPVFAMAQDRRGFLWVATAAGLFRFDGIRFEPISAGVDLVVHGAPSALLVRRNGEVWTSFERSRRFAAYAGGRLRFLPGPPAPHRVSVMQEAPDGTVWALTERIGQPLMRYRDGRWTTFGPEAGAPTDNPFSMVQTGDGTVWLSFTGAVVRLAPHASRFEYVRRETGARGRLSIDPQERIWLTDRHGTYPITGPGGRGAPPPLRFAYRTDAAQIRGWPRFDREGNLWIATYYDGLQRVARPDPRGAASAAEAVAAVENYTARDGLSSDLTTQLFQDAEGNVWLGTRNGLDRFWPASLRFEPRLADPAAFGDLLLRASDGSVYIGEASTVYRVRPGGRPEPILRTGAVEPRTLCEAPDGAIWIGTNDWRVTIWRNGAARPLGPRAPLDITVYDCAFDAAGDYWLTATLGGMVRFRAGRWEPMFGRAGPAFLPKSMTADARGRLFVHWNERHLALLDGPRRSLLAIPFGSYEPYDVALFAAAPDDLFVAGRFGLARLRGGRFQTIYARQAPLFSDLKGMVRTPGGDAWLASPGGILHMTAAQLESAFARPERAPAMHVFGAADGLRSQPHSHSRNAIVQGGDGRLWIATQSGTLWLDPAEITRSRATPRVAISALSADRVYRDPDTVTLPAGTSNIQIDFAVLSFANPRAARVRYRIEGQDADWVEAGTRRQAFYTNLAPGAYRFRLSAADADGVWSEEGASVSFEIPPTFFQSRWFVALCILLAAILLWLLYRLRVTQIARRIRAGLEERLGERERIARELHDTLLQGVQGLVLRFQSVANKLPAEAPPRAQLEDALKRADDVIAEGRDRVQDLRAADASGDLTELLRQRAAEAGFDPAIPVRIVVEGRPRPVHPLVSAELGRIAGEALSNAARHARARNVEITLRYGRRLAVEIRDDGVGIGVEVLANGHLPGHFGLVGMRERAERIGGDLSLDSGPDMGCAVTVTLPARLAFADHAPPRRRLADLFKRRKEPKRA